MTDRDPHLLALIRFAATVGVLMTAGMGLANCHRQPEKTTPVYVPTIERPAPETRCVTGERRPRPPEVDALLSGKGACEIRCKLYILALERYGDLAHAACGPVPSTPGDDQ